VNPLALIPAPYRILALVVLALALVAFGWVKGAQHGQVRLEAYQVAEERIANGQRDANRTRARKAEEKQAAQTVYRDRFITNTVTEVRYVTQPLAACPVPGPAVRLLNDAATCAREDRPASCGAGEQVRDARPAS